MHIDISSIVILPFKEKEVFCRTAHSTERTAVVSSQMIRGAKPRQVMVLLLQAVVCARYIDVDPPNGKFVDMGP